MKKILKKITPQLIVNLYRAYKNSYRLYKLNKLKNKIVAYLQNMPNKTKEQQDVLEYLKNNVLAVFPHLFAIKYRLSAENIRVYVDTKRGLFYVLHNDNRLYFKRGWTEQNVKDYYDGLRLEQDIESPHRYETDDFHVSQGDVVIDAGVAEGNFALDIVERASKLYLFEADNDWIEALQATFAPWKEKVVIVNKYVSNKTDDMSVALDDFFNNQTVNFIKADIEGAEIQLVEGAQQLLSYTKQMKLVLCTYHRHNDAEMLEKMLRDKGFITHFSQGYMIFIYDKFLKRPFLRKALIRATK